MGAVGAVGDQSALVWLTQDCGEEVNAHSYCTCMLRAGSNLHLLSRYSKGAGLLGVQPHLPPASLIRSGEAHEQSGTPAPRKPRKGSLAEEVPGRSLELYWNFLRM